jgi:hypothetical protein
MISLTPNSFPVRRNSTFTEGYDVTAKSFFRIFVNFARMSGPRRPNRFKSMQNPMTTVSRFLGGVLEAVERMLEAKMTNIVRHSTSKWCLRSNSIVFVLYSLNLMFINRITLEASGTCGNQEQMKKVVPRAHSQNTS